MKKYTQEQFDSFPVGDDGFKNCPNGDYTNIKTFGERCSFEGANIANSGYPLMSIGGAGSAYRTTYFFNTENGIIVRSGCFKGTLAEFRERVLADKEADDVARLQYLGFANIVAATWCKEQIQP